MKRPNPTTATALIANLALCLIGATSAFLWPAPDEKVATALLSAVGLLLAALVALDLRRTDPQPWHWKPAALGTGASLLLIIGLAVTRPVTIVFDPETSQVKIAGRIVSEPTRATVRGRVWPDDHELPVVVEPLDPRRCPVEPPFIRIGAIIADHNGTWEAWIACPNDASVPPGPSPDPSTQGANPR